MGVAHEVKTVPTIAFEKNTGETSGGSLVLLQKDALMAPIPRESSRGGTRFQKKLWNLADVEIFSPRLVSVRSNTGETFGSSLVQRQKDALRPYFMGIGFGSGILLDLVLFADRVIAEPKPNRSTLWDMEVCNDLNGVFATI